MRSAFNRRGGGIGASWVLSPYKDTCQKGKKGINNKLKGKNTKKK